MVKEAVQRLKEMKEEFENLDRTFTTTRQIKVNVQKIKEEITEDLKRELQGRSSYGIGI